MREPAVKRWMVVPVKSARESAGVETAHAAVEPSGTPDRTMDTAHAAMETTTPKPAGPDEMNEGRSACC
jgi:hypothetical protein